MATRKQQITRALELMQKMGYLNQLKLMKCM